MQPSAIIFDCDGTLADTMPAHFVAWYTVLQRHGLSFDEDRFYSLGGWPSHKIIELLADEHGREIEADQALAIAHEKEDEFLQSIAAVVPIDRVVNVAKQYHGKIPMAVATGGFQVVCRMILKQVGVLELFDTIVSAEDTERHKPDPAPYLEAAKRLNIDPTKCLVYEDTDPGLLAGKRAGMQVIDVRTFHRPRRITPVAG